MNKLRSVVTSGWLAIVILLLVNAGSVWANDSPDCSIPTAFTKSRPHADDSPTPVRIALQLIDIGGINEVSEEFTVDFLAIVRWNDHRLSVKQLGRSLDKCTVSHTDVWRPFIDIINQRSIVSHYDDLVEVNEDGSVFYLQRFSGTLTSPLVLHDFPFDRQTISILLGSFTRGPDEIDLVFDESLTTIRDGVSPDGWTVYDINTEISTESFIAEDISIVQLEHKIIIDRKPEYYLWNIFAPLVLIVFMAWTVFWIDPEHFGPQVSVSTASALTLIAFLLTTRRLLPQVEYLTRADVIVLGSVILVFFSLGEAVLTYNLAHRGRHKVARTIDRWSRVTYVVFFGLIWLIAWS
jgi:hypothetical protein